jgi:hypothetical protein
VSANHADDPLFKAIAGLPRVEPTGQHGERVRGRCRVALQQPARLVPVAFEPATVGTVCGVYAWQIATIATKVGLP